MKSFLAFFAFLSLLLFAAARKDGGEYWRAVMKDQPMPETLKELVRIEAASSLSDDKTKCDTPSTIELMEEQTNVVEDFEPRPNVSAYSNDASLKQEKSSSFVEDFEPKPIFWVYDRDDEEEK